MVSLLISVYADHALIIEALMSFQKSMALLKDACLYNNWYIYCHSIWPNLHATKN